VVAKAGTVLDIKTYIRHHPRFGYEYVPGYDAELPQPGGGRYRLRINAAGLRSNRDYSLAKGLARRRLLVFGDSFAAGQYISNEERFSEHLERRHPGLEVINFGLEGTGTDQQLLMYEDWGRNYEHDAVLLLPFLQNIRRNLVDARAAIDPATGQSILIPKPKFELHGDRLELVNVPVPNERRPAAAGVGADDRLAPGRAWKQWANRLPGAAWLKQWVGWLRPWEPFPEYASAETPGWRLMARILDRFIAAAEGRPVLLAPVFYVSYVRHNMARNYWERFRSLTHHRNVRLIDLLPAFRALGPAAESAFFEPYDCHWSPAGHLVLADVFSEELAAQGLLP